jgi:hypothetical protein
MNTTQKDSLTFTGEGPQTYVLRICEFDGIAVGYHLLEDRLHYTIPTGCTVGELKDWCTKYAKQVQSEMYRRGIEPTERVLRDLGMRTSRGGKK